MELKKYCKLNKFNNVESKVKRIGSKTPQVWLGIENNKETEDDEDNNQDI